MQWPDFYIILCGLSRKKRRKIREKYSSFLLFFPQHGVTPYSGPPLSPPLDIDTEQGPDLVY
jgi:hypothetical protein